MASAPPWLVTGAAGFVGFHTCRRLLDDGVDVVGVDNLNAYYDPNLKKARLRLLEERAGFQFHAVDVADRSALGATFDSCGPEVVVHLAAQAGVRHSISHPAAYVDSNVVGTANVLEECRRHQVAHLVYASSSSVYGASSRLPFSVHDPVGHPVSMYAATKRAGELMAHTYSHLFGLSTTGLRFFTVYGPFGRPDMAYFAFASAAWEGRPVTVFGDGEQLRDFTYVDDVVEGLVRVARQPAAADPHWSRAAADPASSSAPFRVFNIGHGQQVTVNRMIELLETYLDRPFARLFQPPQPGDLPATHADTSDLETAVGFLPATPVEDGLRRFCEWFRAFHG